jgi:hypothetical protein
MDWSVFQLGFWHPLGPHGHESREDILGRKNREIAANEGWTLWSFQSRTVIPQWQQILADAQLSCFVLCSDSPGAREPRGAITGCAEYRLTEAAPWLRLPEAISVPHPFGHRREASAFVVEDIVRIGADQQPSFGVEWFSANVWRTESLPTRGEYLIRRGGASRLRRVFAVLRLRAPYVVWIRPIANESR